MSTGRGDRRRAQAAQARADALAQEHFDWARERYDAMEGRYGELQDRMVAEALGGVQADYAGVTGRAAADVAQSFGRMRDAELRQLQRFGINPNSGGFAGALRRSGLAQAAAEAGAINQAREAERRWAQDANFGRLAAVGGIGAGFQSQAAAGLDQAHLNQIRNFQSAADRYAGSAAGSAQATGSLVGTGVGLAAMM